MLSLAKRLAAVLADSLVELTNAAAFIAPYEAEQERNQRHVDQVLSSVACIAASNSALDAPLPPELLSGEPANAPLYLREKARRQVWQDWCEFRKTLNALTPTKEYAFHTSGDYLREWMSISDASSLLREVAAFNALAEL